MKIFKKLLFGLMLLSVCNFAIAQNPNNANRNPGNKAPYRKASSTDNPNSPTGPSNPPGPANPTGPTNPSEPTNQNPTRPTDPSNKR